MLHILRLPANAHGKDYVIGDLHGEYDQLLTHLAYVRFDRSQDRLFSVGDLIDRGSNCTAALTLLHKPWFHCVRGNHEQMLIDAIAGNHLEEWRNDWGDWAEPISDAEMSQIAADLDQLPHIIVVGTAAQRFHIVHAALSWPSQIVLTDQRVDALNAQTGDLADSLLWSRWLAFRYRMFEGHAKEVRDAEAIESGLSPTFCGHTPLPEAGWLWSHYMIDLGAGCTPNQTLPMPRLGFFSVADVLNEFFEKQQRQ